MPGPGRFCRGSGAIRSVSAASFPAGISKAHVVLKRATGLVLLSILLLGTWTHAPVGAVPQWIHAESPGHASGADEGDAPRPPAEQEAALKKRRNGLQQSSTQAPSLPSHPQIPLNPALLGEVEEQLLDRTSRQARRCYGLSCELMLSDPALRLHPGHAPPRFRPDSAS